jgi:hypothetical protein
MIKKVWLLRQRKTCQDAIFRGNDASVRWYYCIARRAE